MSALRPIRLLHAATIVLVCALSLFPLYWMFITAVTPEARLLQYPPVFVPVEPDLSAFGRVFATGPLVQWLLNSAILTIASMAAALAISVFAGYSLSRFNSRFADALALLLLATKMIPATLLMVPLYVMFKDWGMSDSRVGLIIAYTTFEIPFATWMLKGYFDSLPRELEQAAEVDGCSPFTAFFRVTLPLAGPGIAAAAIASAVLAWGDYDFARGLLASQSKWPVTVGINSLFGEHVVHWNDIMASSLVSILPVLALFVLVERYIVAGMTSGAVKG
ncbi:MAG: carbohydrate ABC transporter permease [Burkholderiales bacterium]|nr:carbohydrate ABC transporter permease [Burkholderiales bacterium]